MSELQAGFLGDLVSGQVEEGSIDTDVALSGDPWKTTRCPPGWWIPSDTPQTGLGEMRLTPFCIRSWPSIAMRGKAAVGPDGRSWLGTSVGFQFDKKFVNLISLFAGDEARQALQALSWGNLPILNEWRRRWPDRDPVKLHEEYWHTRLVCPGDGEYVWNAEWQTMESTVYGHPGQPKRRPANVSLSGVTGGNFGLTFEKQGLRARAVIDRGPSEGQ